MGSVLSFSLSLKYRLLGESSGKTILTVLKSSDISVCSVHY